MVYWFGIVLLLLWSRPVLADHPDRLIERKSEFTPIGLYEADALILENGFRMILKRRRGARRVSFRLAVDVGSSDFPCEQRETPHFLEHILFAGTSRYGEAELDSLVESHGGYWNATTGVEQTVYELDILSDYVRLGLTTLFEIITDSLFSEKNIDTTREIIAQERSLRGYKSCEWGISHKLDEPVVITYEGSKSPSVSELIGRDELLKTYETYYVPRNMTLVIVGDFEQDALITVAKDTFGSIKDQPVPIRGWRASGLPGDEVSFNAVNLPVFDSDTEVGVAHLRPGRQADDRFPLVVLVRYLEQRLYEELRIKRGLAYNPDVEQYVYRDFGLIVATADVSPERADDALAIIFDELQKAVDGLLDEKSLYETKRGLLLSIAKGLESNGDIADLYTRLRNEIVEYGKLLDFAVAIERVTTQDVRQAAEKYLAVERATVLRQ